MKYIGSLLSLALPACLIALAGCGGSGGSSPVVATANRVAHSQPAQTNADQTLYVSSSTGIAAFNIGTYALERTYGASQGLDDPEALAEDASGNLYVVNQRDNNVVEFAAGTTTTIQTITAGIQNPVALAFDPSGNLYVINGEASEKRADVTVYSPSGSLLRTIKAGINEPAALAFDSAGNLYVGNQGTRDVTVYDGGQSKLSQTIATFFPTYLLIDGSDDLYVAGCGKKCLDGNVVEYSPGGKRIIRSMTTEIVYPRQLALNSKDYLYVAMANRNHTNGGCAVTVYKPRETRPFQVITDGIHGSTGIAIDASDNAYVLNSLFDCNGKKNGDVVVYPPGGTKWTHRFFKPIVVPNALIIGS
jgi:sugar lactone lactonase YvrE